MNDQAQKPLNEEQLDNVVGGVMPPLKDPATTVPTTPVPTPPWTSPKGSTGPFTGIPLP